MGTTNAAPPAIVADERHAEWRVEVIKENALHFVFAVSVRVAQQRDPVAGTGIAARGRPGLDRDQ